MVINTGEGRGERKGDIKTDVVHATYINIDCFDKIYFCVIA